MALYHRFEKNDILSRVKSNIDREKIPTCVRIIPSIYAEDQILSDGHDRGLIELLEGVSSQIHDGTARDELHDHAEVVFAATEHCRGLEH